MRSPSLDKLSSDACHAFRSGYCADFQVGSAGFSQLSQQLPALSAGIYSLAFQYTVYQASSANPVLNVTITGLPDNSWLYSLDTAPLLTVLDAEILVYVPTPASNVALFFTVQS